MENVYSLMRHVIYPENKTIKIRCHLRAIAFIVYLLVRAFIMCYEWIKNREKLPIGARRPQIIILNKP